MGKVRQITYIGLFLLLLLSCAPHYVKTGPSDKAARDEADCRQQASFAAGPRRSGDAFWIVIWEQEFDLCMRGKGYTKQ